jgi:hypothetical protein
LPIEEDVTMALRNGFQKCYHSLPLTYKYIYLCLPWKTMQHWQRKNFSHEFVTQVECNTSHWVNFLGPYLGCMIVSWQKCPFHDERKLNVSKHNQTQQTNAQCKHIPNESVNMWKSMKIILKLPEFYWKQLENKQGFKHKVYQKMQLYWNHKEASQMGWMCHKL